jgi:hypothetical protein
MPVEAELSPKAAERICREATLVPFDQAARSLNIDWGTHFDGKQIQRWSEAIGVRLVRERDGEVAALERGVRPASPANEHRLLVIGMDGGRVQSREKDEQTGSRWKENKVLTVSSCLPGDGHEKPPQKLVTTQVATMRDSRGFGKLARLEAERRGIRNSAQVIVIGDGGNWIDPVCEKHFGCHPRIIDYYHAAEHLHEVSRAVHPSSPPLAEKLAKELIGDLWTGRREKLIERLREESAKAGDPQASDPQTHPRRVLASNVGYFERHREHMDYPAYRKKGWPIGSGITESGVKLFGKRVKGSEQFWRSDGAEAIMALRGLWLSEDGRWDHYWLCPRPRAKAA